MKLIISLFNELQKGVFYLSNIIMKGYSFIMNITSTGVNEPGIVDVWMMLRDICNMFFILILLIIGISTILGIKKYSYRKNLINVLISAFLINYSKVIVGMMIDFAQIFIIPFNNAISSSISLITDPAFIIDAGESSIWAAILGFIFALAFFAVAIIALVYSLIRLVFIWITIAISPIIVLGYGIPFDKVKKSLKGFFQKFISFLMGGILLSFFMWFALYILSSSSSSMTENIKNNTYFATNTPLSKTEEEIDITGSNMMLMIVSLVFLIYAQKFAISSSKQAGSFAGEIASKAGSIGMKPFTGMKKLGLKSANLGKNTLKGATDIPKHYTASAFKNLKGVGISSLRNKSNFFDKKMSNREERLKMGNEAFRQQRTDNYMYGGTPSSKASIKKETLENLKRNKSMDLTRLKSEGASVSEIKLAKFNWDLKTKEKEMQNTRNNLKNASSPDEKDKIQKELNTKRAEFSKIKGDKAKYINELKDIQFGKSSSSEDSSQLKDIKGIMDNIGTGENINLSTEYSDLLGKDGKLKKNITTDSRKEIMATIIAKMKNKNLGDKDEEFIENNSALFRTMNQDVLSTMNSQIDKNYSDDERVKKFKQKIKNSGIFELSDKENADIEKGDKYKEYQDLINEAFSEVKNIKTKEERDEKLGELDKKGVKEDFKELFKKQADLTISRKDLEERRKAISKKREQLDAIVDTADYSKEKYEKDIKEISDLEKEYKKEEKDYKKLKKQVSSKKIKDLEVSTLKTEVADTKEQEPNEGFQNNFVNEEEREEVREKNNDTGGANAGFKSGTSSNQSESQETSGGFGSTDQSENQGIPGGSGSTDQSQSQGTSIEDFEDNLEKERVENKGKTYKETENERRRKARKTSDVESNSSDKSQSQRTSRGPSSTNQSENQGTSGDSGSNNKTKVNRASKKSQSRRGSVDKPNSRKAGNLRNAQKRKKAKESGQSQGQEKSRDSGSGENTRIQEEQRNRASSGFGTPINNNNLNFNKYPGNKENINQFSNTQNSGTNSFSDNIKSKIKDIQDNIIKDNEKELNNKKTKTKNKENSGKNNKKGGPNVNNNRNDQKLGKKRPDNARRGNRNK